jgi:hypothetical protein
MVKLFHQTTPFFSINFSDYIWEISPTATITSQTRSALTLEISTDINAEQFVEIVVFLKRKPHIKWRKKNPFKLSQRPNGEIYWKQWI